MLVTVAASYDHFLLQMSLILRQSGTSPAATDVFVLNVFVPKGAGSFHIHRKTMKELGALAVLGVREQPNLAQNLVTHRH